MRQSFARLTATMTGLMHWNWPCFNITSHSPSVSNAFSTSQENNLTVLNTFILLFSNVSFMRSNSPLLMTVTGEPVSMMANATESFIVCLEVLLFDAVIFCEAIHCIESISTTKSDFFNMSTHVLLKAVAHDYVVNALRQLFDHLSFVFVIA